MTEEEDGWWHVTISAEAEQAIRAKSNEELQSVQANVDGSFTIRTNVLPFSVHGRTTHS